MRLIGILGLALTFASAALAQTAGPVGRAGSAKTDGAAVHYTVHGSGEPTLVLVPGWTCDETSWQKNIPALAKSHRVITVDLPGHGKSAAPVNGTHTMAQYAAAIEAVRAAEKVDKLVLVGHSMGATVITRYAQDHPDRAIAVVLVDGMLADADMRLKLRELSKEAVEPALRPGFIKTMFSPATSQADQDHILAMMTTPTEATARGALAGMAADDALREGQVKVRGHGIFADWPGPPPSYVEQVIPGFTYTKVQGSGHFLMLEKPAEFNKALLDFLATLGTAK